MYSCLGGDPLTSYLNNDLVKTLLHIPAEANPWFDCSDINYTEQPRGSQFVYEELKGKIRMLHYSGDKDGVVPTYGTLEWINNLNRDEVAPWTAFTEKGGEGEATD